MGRNRFGFDFGTVIGKMENPHPTPLSLMQEMVVDGHRASPTPMSISNLAA